MFSRLLLVLSTPFILTACGDSAVTTVKGEFVDSARTTTFSQLLDNRGSCSKTSWDTEKDQMNRKVVEYICLFKNSEDFLAPERQEHLNKLISSSTHNIKYLEGAINAGKEEYESAVAFEKQYYKMHEGREEDDEVVLAAIAKVTERHQKGLSEKEETLAKWRDESDPEKIKAIADKTYPKYDSAIETFRWVVNDKNEITIIDGGLYAQLGNERKQLVKYRNTNQNFQVIAAARDADVNTYIKTLQKYALFKFITE